MAVVRITAELISDIQQLAAVPFRDRTERAYARDKAYRKTHDMFQAVLDAWLEEKGLTEMVGYLPPSFYTRKSYIYVKKVNGYTMSQQNVYQKDGQDVDVLCAMVHPSGANYSMQSIEVNHPSLQHFADHQQAIVEELDAIQQERQIFMDTLGKLLRGSRSLKHALDQWPQLIELVPQHTIDRMNEVVERKKREKAEREEAEPINVGALNMSLTIAKISARSEQ